MEQDRKFIVSSDRLMELAMNLIALVHSHEAICRWLGPYDEGEADDYVPSYYRKYYEENLSYLLLTLASLIRTLDDQKNICDGMGWGYELAQIYRGKEWKDEDNLRKVLNFIIHAEEVITRPELETRQHEAYGMIITNQTRHQGKSIIVTGKERGSGPFVHMIINLQPFVDAVFRVVESQRAIDSE
jgi:hypothetical protein